MDSLKKAIEMRYGDFQKWMEARGIKIKFDNTIWALALFGELYEQFSEEKKNAQLLSQALNTMPLELLKQKITERESKAKEAADKVKKDESPLHLPDREKKKLVTPTGKPISVMDHR